MPSRFTLRPNPVPRNEYVYSLVAALARSSSIPLVMRRADSMKCMTTTLLIPSKANVLQYITSLYLKLQCRFEYVIRVLRENFLFNHFRKYNACGQSFFSYVNKTEERHYSKVAKCPEK